MNKFRHTYLLAVLLGTLLAGFGCERAADTSHPAFRKARLCRDAGDYEAAERQYRNFLAVRPDSADGHLAIASLYDENLNDPFRAIYHYRAYLQLSPGPSGKEMAQAWLAAAESRYREQLNGKDLPPPRHVAVAEDAALIDSLRKQNGELKRVVLNQTRELAALKKSPAAAPAVSSAPLPDQTPVPVPAPAPAPAPDTFPKIHRVGPGDTLGSIARKYYGSSTKFPLIMEANHLTPTTRLKLNQELMIPPPGQP
ncbi:MAG: LysM peptidoglycan-binding domain-containing protein [Victivallaceae bacterium]